MTILLISEIIWSIWLILTLSSINTGIKTIVKNQEFTIKNQDLILKELKNKFNYDIN